MNDDERTCAACVFFTQEMNGTEIDVFCDNAYSENYGMFMRDTSRCAEWHSK